jgi:phosphoribosylformimino-5-aminoimidazole carboxamide ribotide isomerase
MRFRPCIDLHNGKVKQIIGGTLTGDSAKVQTNFESEHDSAYYAELYRKDGLRGGHVIMLGPGNREAAMQAVKAYPGGLQVGGGINCDNALEWLEAGAAQVILTSYIFADGELKQERLDKIFNLVGRENLVLDLSCRLRDGRYYIVTDRWQKFTACEVNSETLKQLAGYCSEFLIHAVDVEGKQAGIDTDLIKIMAEYSPIPAVYAGGIRSLEDIDLIREIGQNRIDYTVGSALDIFGGKLKYSDVLKK